MTDNPLSEGAVTLDWLRGVESLFDLMPDIYFFAKDRSGHFIMVNRGFVQKRTGQADKSKVLGRTDFDFWPSSISEKYVQDDQQVMSTRKSLENIIELAILPDHSTEWHSTIKIPLYDRLNRIAGVAGFGRDLKKLSQLGSLMHMGKVFDHVMRNYKSPINMVEFASLMSMSLSQVERHFKELFGITPMQYLIRVRIDAACQALVKGKEKISDIALQSGFYDSSHLSRNFQKIMGLSPGDYRKQYAFTQDYPRVPNLRFVSLLPLIV